jgi:hypothetical protein
LNGERGSNNRAGRYLYGSGRNYVNHIRGRRGSLAKNNNGHG